MMSQREDLEETLKPWLVEGELIKIISDGVSFACLESEHIGLSRKTKEFRERCELYIILSLGTAEAELDSYREHLEEMNLLMRRNTFSPSHPSEEEMKRWVMEQYGSKHWRDYLNPEDWTRRQREIFNDLRLKCNKAYGWEDKKDPSIE